MTAKPGSKAARPAASGKGQDSGRIFHDQLLSRAPAEDLAGYSPDDLDRAVAIAQGNDPASPARDQRHRHPHRPGHRQQWPPGFGDHRRQRQYAVPVQFRARRNHRERRRADLRHPPGRAGAAWQIGCRRDPCGGEQERRGGRPRQPHPGACRQAVAGQGGRAEAAACQAAQAGAGGGQRLEADARPPRPRHLRFSLCAGAARQGCRHRSDRLSRMAARRQFHLPRHARVPLHRRRLERHARPQRQARARHPRPIPTCWCCAAATKR